MDPTSPLTESEQRLAQVLQAADSLSPETRRALLRQIADLFLAKETHSENEAMLYAAVMKRLVADLDVGARAELASALSHRRDVPASLLGLIAGIHDEYEIVGLLRRGEIEDFVGAFSRATNLSPDEARAALVDSEGERLVSACAAAQFTRAAYSAIVLLSDPLNLRQSAKIKHLLDLYDAPPFAHAA